MHNLPLSLYDCAQVKELDRLAQSDAGISSTVLMERAGQAAWQVLQREWPHCQKIAVVCGQGNNGGDGYVIARLAKLSDKQVIVYDLFPDEVAKRSVEAKEARAQWIRIGGAICSVPSQFDEELIIDAIVGTGSRLPLSAFLTQVVDTMNASQKPVFAIDIPSGLCGDTGKIDGTAVHAAVTITFIGMKTGLVAHQGNEVVGKLYYDNLGVDFDERKTLTPVAYRVDYAKLIAALPLRCAVSNKGDHGHVVIVGAGEAQYGGAVSLAAEAALRAGTGRVSAIVAPESYVRAVETIAEVMLVAYTHPKEASALLARASVLLLGPGGSQNAWAKEWFEHTIATSLPIVVDADALNWLAKNPRKLTRAIITPHPGEAARLLGTTVEVIQADRMAAAKALQAQYGAVVVLKGAGTVVLDDAGIVHIMAGGFPALATAGTGDILGGVIAALVAQGVSLADAAKLGVCVHALASAEQASASGTRGMLASDLFTGIRKYLNPHHSSDNLFF